MRLPYRSINNIQVLPSIHTAFPANYDSNNSGTRSELNSGSRLIRQIEDGIEVVPFERSNNSAPILSPDQEEKEVLYRSRKERDATEKPLPSLPANIWQRMSLKQRVIAILGIQFVLLFTVGLSLLAVRGRPSQGDLNSEVRATGEDPPLNLTSNAIRPGAWDIPIQSSQQQSSACLARMNESAAWQCASDTKFELGIQYLPDIDNSTWMTTFRAASSNGSIRHGHQGPNFGPVKLTLVNDASTEDKPAYHFSTTYDRVVLLRESDLTLLEKPQAQPVMSHPYFQTNESIWQCIFNETRFEGYIFSTKLSAPRAQDTGANSTETSAGYNLTKYPYVVKLIEQRVPNPKNPYCQKMVVQQDGSLASRSEKAILNLSEPVPDPKLRGSLVDSARSRRRQQPQTSNYCRCQWLMQ